MTPAAPRMRPVSVPRVAWPIMALVLLFVFNLFFTEGFFDLELRGGRLYGSLIDIGDNGAQLALVAIGMTLVIATAGVDLSVGAVMAISGAIAAGLVARPEYSVLSNIDIGSSFALAALIALLVSGIIGAGNGTLVAVFGVQPIVATLVLMVAGRGIAQLLTSGQKVEFSNEAFLFLGSGSLLHVPITIPIVLVAFVGVAILARKTALGLFIEAIGGNPVASRYAGVRSRWVTVVVYLMCGLLAGMAGLLYAADITEADAINAGLYIELDAILAVVIGGTALTGGRFSLLGSMIGAVLIQSVNTTILLHDVPVQYNLIVKAVVVIAVCLLQSARFRTLITGSLRRATT